MFTAAICRHLHAQGLVTFDAEGADCFLETAPREPVNAVAVSARPGSEASGGHGYDAPGFQVIVRADGDTGQAREGYERAAAIRDELHGVSAAPLGTGSVDETHFVSIHAESSAPVSLGRDDANRHRWSVSYRCEYRHVTALRA